ncbi:hypothetical protein A8C32_11900 [Flavivirga aquatica]|uniref:Preprotein translocase subunit SecA n=1 Tax=Flavivirga aquatica TaxID=1849968 RepID=A0A1E5TDG1_9FLAO|nr:SEC-C metal-binding domain-containing protein [Flavivirga aquatica]OEK09414.1 hypothetical protein A8C32_11900 [Flavivirga aquatica]
MKPLKIEAIKVSYDSSLLDKQNHITPYVSQLIEKLYYDIPKGKESTLKKLIKYTNQFPKVPIFKNYLMTYYSLKDNTKKADEVNKWIIKEHPEYLYAKINYANNLLNENDIDKMLGLIGESLLLHELYPERDAFLVDEIISYYVLTIRYLYLINDEKEANSRLDILKNIDEDHHKLEQAEYFKQDYFFRKLTLTHQEENSITVQVKDRRQHLQTTTPPDFYYPKQINYLYTNSLESISKNQLDELLNLDHTKLVDDLIKTLYDSIHRHDYFTMNFESNNQDYFPIHATNILLFLKNDKAIDAILEILRQDDYYIDFWFGDTLSDSVFHLLYYIGKNNKDKLIAFIKEEHISSYNKSIVAEAFMKISVFDDTLSRKEILNSLDDILNFLIENKNNTGIFDTDLNAFFIGNLIDYNAVELLSKIKSMFDMEIVNTSICGDYSDFETEMSHDNHEINPIDDCDTIEKIYDLFTYNHNDFNDDLLEDYYKTTEPVITEAKIGRNDPCHCGSGKKYKKCCLNA